MKILKHPCIRYRKDLSGGTPFYSDAIRDLKGRDGTTLIDGRGSVERIPSNDKTIVGNGVATITFPDSDIKIKYTEYDGTESGFIVLSGAWTIPGGVAVRQIKGYDAGDNLIHIYPLQETIGEFDLVFADGKYWLDANGDQMTVEGLAFYNALYTDATSLNVTATLSDSAVQDIIGTYTSSDGAENWNNEYGCNTDFCIPAMVDENFVPKGFDALGTVFEVGRVKMNADIWAGHALFNGVDDVISFASKTYLSTEVWKIEIDVDTASANSIMGDATANNYISIHADRLRFVNSAGTQYDALKTFASGLHILEADGAGNLTVTFPDNTQQIISAVTSFVADNIGNTGVLFYDQSVMSVKIYGYLEYPLNIQPPNNPTVYDISGNGNHGTWGGTGQRYSYSLNGSTHILDKGYDEYDDSTNPTIQVPHDINGDSLVAPTVPALYTLTRSIDRVSGEGINMGDVLLDYNPYSIETGGFSMSAFNKNAEVGNVLAYPEFFNAGTSGTIISGFPWFWWPTERENTYLNPIEVLKGYRYTVERKDDDYVTGIKRELVYDKQTFIDPNSLQPVLWLDSSRGVETTDVAGTLYVDKWNDRSVFGNDATQGTSTRRPVYASNEIQFVDVNDKLVFSSVPLGTEHTIIIKFRHNSTGDGAVVLNDSPEWLQIRGTPNNDVRYNYAAGAISIPTSDGIEDNDDIVLVVRRKGQNIRVEFKTNDSLLTLPTNDTYKASTIGGFADNSQFAPTGEYKHVLLYDYELTDEEVADVKNYLNK